MELKEKYSNELVAFAGSLIEGVRKSLSDVSIENSMSLTKSNGMKMAPSTNNGDKTIIVVGIIIALCGFLWLGTIIGLIGLAILFYGYYRSKQKKCISTIPVKSASVQSPKTSMLLYTAVETSHKQAANKWKEFIEGQRLKINTEIKLLNLDENTQMRLLDSQISNTVLKFPVMDELNTLNTIERSNGSFSVYVSDFLSRYSNMINTAVAEQITIYNKLSE